MEIKIAKGLYSILIPVFLVSIILFSCSWEGKEIISYYDNGNPKLIYYVKKNKEKVYEKMFYENGKIKYEGGFKEGKKIGLWNFNFENGELFAKCDFTSSKSGKDWQVYLLDRTKIISFKDKVEEITFYEGGGLAAIKIKKDKDEKEYKFFPSYRLMEERTYRGNVLNGETNSFYENGNINSKNFFKDGMQDGVYILYFENGGIQIKGGYDMDKKIGTWEYFKQDGSSDGEEEYSKDGSLIKQRDSGIKYLDKDGNEIIF